MQWQAHRRSMPDAPACRNRSLLPRALGPGTMAVMFFSRRPAMLAEGTAAPAFKVQDHHDRTVTLSDFAGLNLVLWFYPKADTPG